MPVFLQKVFGQRTGIDSDADGNIFSFSCFDHGFHSVSAADIARIQAQAIDAGRDGCQSQTIIKMNIRNDRDRTLRADRL